MRIILPINSLAGSAFSNGVEFAGATDIAFELEVAKTLDVTFAGATQITFFAGQAAILFSGATDIAFALRLNDEANVFPAVEFAGATDIAFALETAIGTGVEFAGATELGINLHLERAQEFGFTFFVDITDSVLSAALNNNIRRYSARLLVDGTSVPIRRAAIDAPEEMLGTELSVVLARPDVSQVLATATITFELGLWGAGAWQWVTLIEGGQMSGRGAHYANEEGLPADSVEVTFVDVMGDRWNRRPGAQTILYDPQAVDAPSSDTITSQTIYDRQGNAISPVYSPVSGMRLQDVLNAAFVEGCGFSAVITNIDNFPVEQVVFSLTGGYHAGVKPLLTAFEPIPFVVGNDLWLVTLDNPLPAGFSARDFPPSMSEAIDDTLPASEPANALLVHLKDDGTGEYFTEELESKTEPHGTFGDPDYTETDIERRVRKWRTFAAPTTVTREEEVYLRKRTLNANFQEVSIEERRATFDRLNRPTGYTRTLALRLPDLASSTGAMSLQDAQSEEQTISYAPHPLRPERDVQAKIETRLSGLILSDNGNQYLGEPYRLPMLDAHKSGVIDPQGDQSSAFGPVRTIIETTRVNGGQVVRDRQVINHVSGVPETPTTQILPGDSSFDRRRQSGKTRTVLLTVEGTEGQERRVQEFDATGLPSDVGMRLAEKKLSRLNSQPRNVTVQMPFADFAMRRGVDLLLHGRSGHIGTYIVRGYGALFEALSNSEVKATMNLSARELK